MSGYGPVPDLGHRARSAACVFCTEDIDNIGGAWAVDGPVCAYCIELSEVEAAEVAW